MTPPTTCDERVWMDEHMGMDNGLNRFPVRKNPRLKNYDYSTQNYYFVTICCKNKCCFFGNPDELTRLGDIASDAMKEIEYHFPGVRIDKWVIMPNHVHAIIALPGTGVQLSTVVGLYKSSVTRRIHRIVSEAEVWQTSFHDHVIRNQTDYERIWEYIDTNPARWLDDCFYIPQQNI